MDQSVEPDGTGNQLSEQISPAGLITHSESAPAVVVQASLSEELPMDSFLESIPILFGAVISDISTAVHITVGDEDQFMLSSDPMLSASAEESPTAEDQLIKESLMDLLQHLRSGILASCRQFWP
jgi:hypothetical protein